MTAKGRLGGGRIKQKGKGTHGLSVATVGGGEYRRPNGSEKIQ